MPKKKSEAKKVVKSQKNLGQPKITGVTLVISNSDGTTSNMQIPLEDVSAIKLVGDVFTNTITVNEITQESAKQAEWEPEMIGS